MKLKNHKFVFQVNKISSCDQCEYKEGPKKELNNYKF